MDALKLWSKLFQSSKYTYNPYVAGEAGGDEYCFFCGEFKPDHKDDCVYLEAKKMLEADKAAK